MLDQQMVDFHMGNREIHVCFNREPYLVGFFWRIGTYSWSHISRRMKRCRLRESNVGTVVEKMKK